MLSTSEFLGNRKPDTLVTVEKAIWRVVFALADERLNPTELLKKLADELNIDHELTSLACNTPISNGDVRINPSLLFHEGWGLPDRMNAVDLPQAGILMESDG